jgi:hypothetical protein
VEVDHHMCSVVEAWRVGLPDLICTANQIRCSPVFLKEVSDQIRSDQMLLVLFLSRA